MAVLSLRLPIVKMTPPKLKGTKMAPAQKRVTKSGKDTDGDILCLCQDYADWSPRQKQSAISDIESNAVDYYIEDRYGRRAYIEVVKGSNGKYLRSKPNSECSDNLATLPDCSC